jgi:MFS family permease
MKKHRIFYGWWVLAAVFLISGYANGVVFYSFTAMLEPITKELGWSYARASFAASIRGFESSFLGPLVGFLFDRFGPRKLVFAGGILIGLGLLLVSRSHSIVTFYIAFLLMSTGLGSCAGFLLSTVLGNWFRRKISIVTGIALCGGAAGSILVPLVTRLIDIYDWRKTMVIIGVAAFGIILPLSLIVRHKPEQYGLLPDGDSVSEPSAAGTTASAPDIERKYSLREILGSGVFWHISLSFMCHYLVIGAVLTHIMPYLSSINIPRSSSSFVASGIPLISVLGRLSFGWLGDRYNNKGLAAFGFVLIIIGLLLLIYIDILGTWILVPFIILFGIGFGGPVPMTMALLYKSFGRASLGIVAGTCMAVIMIGNIVGPPLAGWFFDHYGSYQGAWFVFIGVIIAGGISVLTIPRLKSNAQTAG